MEYIKAVLSEYGRTLAEGTADEAEDAWRAVRSAMEGVRTAALEEAELVCLDMAMACPEQAGAYMQCARDIRSLRSVTMVGHGLI